MQQPGWKAFHIPKMAEHQFGELQKIYEALRDTNELRIASRRFNRGIVRENDDDAIVDLVVGLETLLLNDSDELRYKFSLRLAALWKKHPDSSLTPQMVFKACKTVYDRRSFVAHGNRKAGEKHLKIKLRDKELDVLPTAIEFLRIALRVLVDNPKYLISDEIENDLLL